jgi:phage major head subunit gpT-like protein
MNFEQWLAANNYDAAALNKPESATQRKHLEAAWKAEQEPDEPRGGAATTATATRPAETQTLDDIVAAARAEEDRKTKVTEIVARFIQENPSQLELAEALGRQAIEGKWKVDRLELELLRERRTTGVSSISRLYQPEVTEQVIEASVCRAGGLRDLEKTYDERTLEASDRHFKHGMGLADLVMTFARRNGFAGTSVKSNLAGALRAAFSPDIKAAGAWGPSTGGGLSGILSNVANKFLRDGFNSVDSTWRQFAAVRSVNDFKQISTYSLTGGLTFDKVPAGGEIKHGQIAAETYTNQVDTYAKMLGLDRRDLINDDLGALTNVSRRLGRGGALKLNDVIWTVFLNNSAFFTSGRLNVSTGAGSALSLAGLDAANAKFLTQTDPDGNPMGATPKILLVPPALWSTAQTLMSSTALVSGATTTPGTPSNNVWAGMFRVVTSPYMQNSNYTGYSAAAWYLLADPNDIPVIEVAFLNGQEAPTVESADADFGMLGVAFRGFHDFGASLQEYRAGVRSAGS